MNQQKIEGIKDLSPLPTDPAEHIAQIVKIRKRREAIAERIEEFRHQFKAELDDLQVFEDNWMAGLIMATMGEPYKHPDGSAELVVKKKRQTFGQKIDIDALDMQKNRAILGDPSNWLTEVPATYKQRSMAEVRRVMDLRNLNDDAKALLFKLLDARGGEEYHEVVVHDLAMAVEEAIAEEKGAI